MSDHHARVLAAFTEQAETFQDSRLNTAFTKASDWLVDLWKVSRCPITMRGYSPHSPSRPRPSRTLG